MRRAHAHVALAVVSLAAAACTEGDLLVVPAPLPSVATAPTVTAKPDAGPPPLFTVTPAHGSMFGFDPVVIEGDFSTIGDVVTVSFGDIHGVDVVAENGRLRVNPQGGPTPGPVDVTIVGTSGMLVQPAAFTLDPAPTPGTPRVWMAYGASLTAGTQSGGITIDTQVRGPAAQVARAVGVYMPMPLLKRGLAQPILPSDIDATCHARAGAGPDPGTFIGSATDPTTHLIDLRLARVDPSLPSANVAVPGATLLDQLKGSQGGTTLDLEHFLEPLDGNPSDLFKKIHTPELAHIEMLDPDVGMATDMMANDIDGAVVAADDIHLEHITDLATVTAHVTEIASRLGALHGQHFLANLPNFRFLPNVATVRATRIAAGTDTDESFEAKMKIVDDATNGFNAALADAAAAHPNLHVVDFNARVEMFKAGMTIGGDHLTGDRFGGLLSLDELHFTDTGYALVANMFLDAMSEVLGITLPRVDVEEVHARDPLSPSQLKAAGIDCGP